MIPCSAGRPGLARAGGLPGLRACGLADRGLAGLRACGSRFECRASARISFLVASLTHFEGLQRVANIKSQIKRNKQNEKARQRNKAVKSSLRTAVRKFREAADAGDTEAATVAMRTASQNLDKAASKGVIHKNQAANRKSAMATRCAELSKS